MRPYNIYSRLGLMEMCARSEFADETKWESSVLMEHIDMNLESQIENILKKIKKKSSFLLLVVQHPQDQRDGRKFF